MLDPLRMKKTSNDTGANKRTKIDYFEHARKNTPVRSFNVSELRKRVDEAKKKKDK